MCVQVMPRNIVSGFWGTDQLSRAHRRRSPAPHAHTGRSASVWACGAQVNAPIVPLWHYKKAHESRSSAGINRAKDSTNDPTKVAAATRREMPRGRVAYRHAVRQRLLPALRAFGPDLILLSAGFDGGGTDQGNVKLTDELRPNGVPDSLSAHRLFCPFDQFSVSHAGLDLEEEDFAWLTDQVVAVANVNTRKTRSWVGQHCEERSRLQVCCNGKVVSVLEGGYGTQVWHR